MNGRLERRAARLDYLHGLARDREAIALTIPPDLDLSDEERDDIALINAVLDAERELRARRWAALEALLPMVPPGGDVDEVLYLRSPDNRRAILLMLDVGWFWPVPPD